MESSRTRPTLSHRDQLIAVGLVGILVFTLFFALVLLPTIQNTRAGSLHQSVTISGYVFIGNKGNPTYVNFDNPTTGMITGNAFYSDKSYTASLISGYDYSVTVTYLPSGAYSYSTCVPSPSLITTSSSSSIRQDFSC